MANLRGRVVAELDAPRGIIPGRDAVGNDVDRVVGFGGEARAGFLNEGEVRLFARLGYSRYYTATP